MTVMKNDFDGGKGGYCQWASENGRSFEPLVDGIYRLKIPLLTMWTTSVLVRKNGQNVLIDSGSYDSDVDNYIVPALRKMNLKPSDIDFLLATHTHWDHIGGHVRLRELGVRKIAVYDKGLPKLCDPMGYQEKMFWEFGKDNAPHLADLKGLTADVVLHDGDEIAGLRLITTPGHDDDCVSYLDPDSSFLFSGDALQGIGIEVLGCAFYRYLSAYEETVRKLQTMKIKSVLFSHPTPPWSGLVSPCETVLTETLGFIRRYDELLKNQAPKPLAERAEELILALGGTVPQHLVLAMYTVREHLRRLGLDGSTSRDEGA